jgi:hypothetical protein
VIDSSQGDQGIEGRPTRPNAHKELTLDATTHAVLSLWENFYVIVGSSGAALTGLQFVVIVLMADSTMPRSPQGVDAFGTPNVVHFCTVLLLSAILSAPWHSLVSVAVILGIIGLAGMVYSAIIIRRARRQTGYKPVLEDWLWHAAFPLISHAVLVGSAIALARGVRGSLFAIGGVSVALLFTGIHNAWDTIVFLALDSAPKADGTETPSQ